ncbi:MAG: glycosyltransferase family protein [Bacteroidota bacterium]
MSEIKKALICPLDWGIGHATRCIPVIEKLREQGFEVIFAASGRPLEFLKKEFPGVPVVMFPGIKIRYPRNGWIAGKMLWLAPLILFDIWREHRVLKKIVRESGISLVISDNRYGCWNATIPSVFMTHQLEIQVPAGLRLIKGPLNFINRWLINKYSECWVPDFEPHRGLAGDLSHPARLPLNTHYIGILSRFSKRDELFTESNIQSFDLLVMLSGPEPQRTILEEKILMQLVNINMQVAMVRGIPESDETFILDGRIHVFSHLETAKMKTLIQASALVIARSGYSSIMDIVTLGKRAIFIPTPGQPEQEYLSHYLMDKKIYFSINQKDFDLLYAIEMSKNFPGLVIRNDYSDLISRIKEKAIIS